MKTMFFGAVMAVMSALASPATAAQAEATQSVWQHHIDAWEARDLEAIVSDYDTESVLILNSRIFRGPDEIRQVFVRLFEIFDNGVNRIDPPVLDGRVVFITWNFAPAGDQAFFGTDTFVIEDGKIAVQTIASPLYEVYPVSLASPRSTVTF